MSTRVIRLHDALTALAAVVVIGLLGWLVVGGIRSDDYAYDGLEAILQSLAFLLPMGAFLAAPVAVGSILARSGRSCWLGQLAALAVMVAGIVAIFTDDSSTAAIGLLYLPFVAAAAGVVGLLLQRGVTAVVRRRR